MLERYFRNCKEGDLIMSDIIILLAEKEKKDD
jgi:hypothetical protein